VNATWALLFIAGCSDFSRNRDRYETAVSDARVALASAAQSPAPACTAREANNRTSWANLPRSASTDPNVRALAFADGPVVVTILETDVHGFRRAYAFTDPEATLPGLATAFDRCGGGEWESIAALGDGWFRLESRLD
jgi:hypothetical protein